jgi:hypothetical protein
MSALGGYLGMLLFVGDARAAANPEQRKQLRETILPLTKELGDPSTSPRRVVQLVRMILEETVRIMGPHWELSGEAKQLIGRMVK